MIEVNGKPLRSLLDENEEWTRKNNRQIAEVLDKVDPEMGDYFRILIGMEGQQ